MAKKRSPELIELQENFWRTIIEPYVQRLPKNACWYAGSPSCFSPCSGHLEAAHWIKRQRVRNALQALDFPPDAVQRAEWDVRNGVPMCQTHHRRFDAQQMPPLVIWRHEVPNEVEAFVEDWGLETALADRCPLISAKCQVQSEQFADEAAVSERALYG